MRVFILVLLFWATGAAAHEASHEHLRVVVVSERDGQTVIHLRVPAPLLFAREAAARPLPSAPVEAPFLRLDSSAHQLDRAAIADAPETFMERVLATISITVEGRPAEVSADAFAVQHVASLPRLRTPEEGRAALASADLKTDPHIAEAYVDAQLTINSAGDLALSFPLDAIAFPGHVHLSSVFVDARVDPPRTRVRLGALTTPIVVERP